VGFSPNKMSSDHITIYTDGAARGNPGRGGYGVILMSGNHRKELSQGYKLTTNNRMELMAVITGLKALKKEGMNITIYTDSQYVSKAIEEGWLNNWIKTNFKKGKKNVDLWKEYYQLAQKHRIKFIWIRGHADNPFNNRCDELATAAADGDHLLIDEGYEKEKNTLF
jgi:ribonuclease HI